MRSSGAGDLRFKYRSGQIGHSVVNGSPALQHFVKSSCVARVERMKSAPQARCTLRRNTASIIRDLI